jgi:ABC-type multidrug transport system ATPase subunit
LEDLCDEVAIINKGEIVFKSFTKEIRSKIKNELTQETYQSLEEIFLDITLEKNDAKIKELSWL